MSDALNTKALKVLFSKGGAPKWVIEPGANSDKDAMTVVVRKGQTVEWKRHGDSTPFTIRFRDRTPFPGWGGLSKTSTGVLPNTVTGIVGESDDLDVFYKYDVEVVGQDPLDPAIIIDK
jgi:hypothetical protein